MKNHSFRRSIELLLTRRFGTFWFACLLSNIGTWAQQVAQPWLLLSLGASSFLLGLDAFALGAPVLLLTLIGGALADRADRRRVIGVFQSLQMLCPLLIVVLLVTGSVHPWIVIVLSLVVGITDALSMPSFQSIVPSLVEHDQIPTAMALNSTQFNISRILGPSVAGMLMASIGALGAFAISAASYVPFLAAAFWVLPRTGRRASAGARIEPGGLLAGVRRIAGLAALRGSVLTALVNSLLCAPLITFCPVLVQQIHQGDVTHFSLTIAAFGTGGLIGGIGLLGVDPSRDRRPISSWSAVLYAAVVALAALNPWSWALPLVFALAGMAMAVSNVSANTFLQSEAPQRVRGQAISLYMLAMRGGVAIGGLLTGISVSALGIREALLINAALAVTAQVAIGRVWLRQPLPRPAA